MLRLTPFLVVAAIGGLASSAALGEEPLPGVSGDHRIVKPLPEPNDDALPVGENGGVKVGNWDVKISGSITVDIGTGNLPPPRSNR